MEDGVGEGPVRDVLDSRRAGHLVIQGGIVRGAGYVLSTLLALLGIALVTRYLGVDDFGRFQTVLSLITVVGAVSDAGMATLGLREYAQRVGDDRRHLLRVLLGVRLALTLVGVAIATGISVALGYDQELVLGTALAGLGLGLLVVSTTLTIPLAAELRNVALTVLEMLRNGLTVAGYAVLVAVGAGVAAFLGVSIPVGLALIVAAALLTAGRSSMRPSLDFSEWGRLLRAAIAFSMATAVGTIYLYSAQVLTAIVTDARDTGLFSASFRVFVVVAMIPGLLVTVAFPLLSRAARDDHDRLSYAVRRLFDTTTILGFGAAIGLVTAAPTIIDIMAGSGFDDAVPALRMQGLTVLASFALAPLGFALLSLHAHRQILIVNLVGFAVMLVAVGGLAAAVGPAGAAFGMALGETTLAIGYYIAIRRVAPSVTPRFDRAARGFLVALPCAALAFVTGPPSWVVGIVALALYTVLLFAVRAVPDELIVLIRSRGRAA